MLEVDDNCRHALELFFFFFFKGRDDFLKDFIHIGHRNELSLEQINYFKMTCLQ